MFKLDNLKIKCDINNLCYVSKEPDGPAAQDHCAGGARGQREPQDGQVRHQGN